MDLTGRDFLGAVHADHAACKSSAAGPWDASRWILSAGTFTIRGGDGVPPLPCVSDRHRFSMQEAFPSRPSSGWCAPEG